MEDERERLSKIERQVTAHEVRIQNLSNRICYIEREVDKVYKVLSEIKDEINGIRLEIVSRPSWGSALVITMLTALVVGLAVYLVESAGG